MRANASRPVRTFCRCRVRSSRVKGPASTFSPMRPILSHRCPRVGYSPAPIDHRRRSLGWPAMSSNEPTQPPIADRNPTERVHHGDVFVDPYEWLRAKDDDAVIAYLEAENAWTQRQTSHLIDFSEAIFHEIKARTKQTDLSVPTYRTHTGRQCLLVLRAHGGGLGVPDLLPGRGDHRAPAAARHRGHHQRRAGPARREQRGGGRGLLLDRRVRRLPGRPAPGVLHRHQRRRTLHPPDRRPGRRRAAR